MRTPFVLMVLTSSVAASCLAEPRPSQPVPIAQAPQNTSSVSSAMQQEPPLTMEPPEEIPQGPQTVAENLQIPWSIAFLPDGDILVTERPGTLLRFFENGNTRYTIDGVEHRGEGGLLGLALHPDFPQNRMIYLYLTTREGGGTSNRVERYRLERDTLAGKEIIIEGIPGAMYHDGGRIAFGPDGMLYITTGDAGNANDAQDTRSLAGKILRIHADGSIPEDNPFGNAVYSYGHRNPQGITWDDANQLWSTEHGRSGLLSGFDELNLIVKGGNYGWPEIQGDETADGMISPVLHSGPDTTWAPASATYQNGSIFFGGLRGETLYEAVVGNGTSVMKEHFKGEFGRIREVVTGLEGSLWFTTSNKDGRGNAAEPDDRIIRVQGDLK